MKKLFILLGLLIVISGCTNSVPITEHDDFAKYLTSQGIAMAGTEWCPHCKAQKELFGDSFQYVDYHDCDVDSGWCVAQGVEGYPTWVFPNGQLYPGTRTIEQLKELSGYNE